MNNDGRFMKALGTIQAICGWILTVSVRILSLFLALVFPFRAFLFGLIAIGICPKVEFPDTLRVVVAVVALIVLGI
jgi:hypothetical protein